jgi:uncharacterized protein
VPRVTRLDLSPLGGGRRTPQGGLIVSARCARTGVQEYPLPDGSVRREYRPPEEVFAPASVDSFRLSTLTVGHPLQVTPANWREHAVGHAGADPKEDGGKYLSTELHIQDDKAAKAVERRGLTELSCGYSCDLEMTPGVTPDGYQYDAVQRNIRHNHLALLPAGHARGGPELRIRLDAKGDSYLAGMPGEAGASAGQTEGEGGTPPLTVETHVHTHTYEGPAPAPESTKKKTDALEGENAALKGQVGKLTADLADARDPKKLDALVTARIALVTEAQRYLVGDKRSDGKNDAWDPSGKSDLEVKRLVLAKLSPSVKLDGKSEEYVAAAYEIAVDAARAAGAGTRADAQARSVQRALPRGDDAQPNMEKDAIKDARDAMVSRMKARGRDTRDKWPPKKKTDGGDAPGTRSS